MSILIHVDAYSGYRANERPSRFWLDATLHDDELTGVYEIEAVEDHWYDPSAEYFKVRTPEGKRYNGRVVAGDAIQHVIKRDFGIIRCAALAADDELFSLAQVAASIRTTFCVSGVGS
jgi:hypothetical protein